MLTAKIAKNIAAMPDDPEARFRRRCEFYGRYGYDRGAGYGTAELAFMRWTIDRGSLNPLDHPQRPGSIYWRAVNAALACSSELAVSIRVVGRRTGVSPLDAWFEYLEHPTARSWYRAHNETLIWGMLASIEHAATEHKNEQALINETYYRAIIAEALVQRAAPGVGWQLVADPRSRFVDLLVRVQTLYPRRYPCPTNLSRPARRLFVGTMDQLGVRLTQTEDLQDLVLRRLRPLAGRLDDRELLRRFSCGEAIYPECTR